MRNYYGFNSLAKNGLGRVIEILNIINVSTKICKARQRCFKLRDEEGNMIHDEEEKKSMVQRFFTNIFSFDVQEMSRNKSNNQFPRLETHVWDKVNALVSDEEIKMTIFKMAPYKALGPDGFHAGFYQKAWGVVGNSVSKQVKEYM